MSARSLGLVVLFGLAGLITSGCTRIMATTIVCPTADAPARPASDPARVALMVGRAPDAPYVILGRVAVQSHKGEDPLGLLRAAAARLGADAVIDVRHTRTDGGVVTRGMAIVLEHPHEL